MTRARPRRRHYALQALGAAVSERPQVWTRAQLCDRWSQDTLSQALAHGCVARVAPGLYTAPQFVSSDSVRISVAGRWAGPTARVGGLAALVLYGLERVEMNRVLVVAPLHFSRKPLVGVRVWRTQSQFLPHVFDGVATVSPADAAIQAWRESVPVRRVGVVLDAARHFRLTSDLLVERLAAYPRMPARATLEQVIPLIDAGVTSYLEYVAKTAVFVGPEFSPFVWQARVTGAGRSYRADMWHPGVRLAVEFDGAQFHSGDHARRRDIERDAALASAGITTMRFTYDDIVRRPQWCRDRVLSAVRHLTR